MRKCGILLHPTSLPGRYGIGDLGRWAYRFADFLVESGQKLWQVLPLGPPGYGDSPYQSYSSRAGNPLLISLDALVDQGWLSVDDLTAIPAFPETHIDFHNVLPFKVRMLKKAAEAFMERGTNKDRREFDEFCLHMASWLNAFAEFAALKEANGGRCWTQWETGVSPRPEDVLAQKFIQFEFFRQWRALRKYCNERGISIIGDIPIFVAHDSADVWGNPDLFDLDERGVPRTIAGVPHDYFSKTGQCWGNPLYRWDKMAETGYHWWIERVHSTLDLVDFFRLDHFRGFEKYYEIPGGSTTAEFGRWVEGPGDLLFSALHERLGKLPFIAEDLGIITPEVHALRDRWEFPGMRVLQFAFNDESADHPFKPHNFIRHCVVYTGTHDNDTTLGWFKHTHAEDSTQSIHEIRVERDNALRYLNSSGEEIHWDMIRLAIASVADTAIYPLQDVLGLGSEARMNRPGMAEGNWSWRFCPQQLTKEYAARLLSLTKTYGR